MPWYKSTRFTTPFMTAIGNLDDKFPTSGKQRNLFNQFFSLHFASNRGYSLTSQEPSNRSNTFSQNVQKVLQFKLFQD